MENFVKRMIEEHSALIVKIDALENYIYSERSNNDDKVEFGNKCVQLSAMRSYEKALRARLINQNIEITDDGSYYEKVAQTVIVENDEIGNSEGNCPENKNQE